MQDIKFSENISEDLISSPLSKFRGYSGEHPALKDKSDEVLLREINALHDKILNTFGSERILVLSSITQRPYNPLPKYFSDITFSELYVEYPVNVSGARELIICLMISVATDNPYISFIREKIMRLARQNHYKGQWSEAVIAVKCSYSKTHLYTFFLERYSYRSIQGWFKEDEKTSLLCDTLLNPKTRYSLNNNREIAEKRTIGVGYKDKGASTPEHAKSPNQFIQDCRCHVKIAEFNLSKSRSFYTNLNLSSLEDYSVRLNNKVNEFNLKEDYYERINNETKQERIDSGRKLEPTEGPGKPDRSEDRELPVKNWKSSGGNYPASGRQNSKKSSDSHFGIFNFQEIKERIYGKPVIRIPITPEKLEQLKRERKN
jgi:hypothetical protein